MPSNLPREVTSDILRRLPVKSLIRFKCVSKPWCSLIDGPDFIKIHLRTSLETKSNRSVILKNWRLEAAELDSLETAVELNSPLKFGGGIEVFGSCHGLIAVRDSDADLALWNPSTRDYRKLPVPQIKSPGGSDTRPYVFNGFGYDPVSDDYKVVRMVIFTREDRNNDVNEENFNLEDDFVGAEVKVYSLRSNSWRTVSDLPYYLRFMHHHWYYLFFMRWNGVLANGALHWIAPCRPEIGRFGYKIVGFDLSTEKFHKVAQPDYRDSNFCMDLAELGGCLCIVCNCSEVRVDIWMMKEYGVNEPWTKMFSVGRPKTISSFRYLKPITYSNSGDKVLLLLNNEKLAWYDLKTKRVKSVKFDSIPRFGVELYVGSLVPLNEKRKRTQEEEKEKNNRKKRDDFLSEGFKLVL